MRSSFDELLNRPLSQWIALDWEKALYLTLVVLAIATRLWGLGIRVQSHDESLHTKYSWNLYAGQGFQHTPLMHGPFLFHVTALSYFLFGDNDFTARLAVALLGVVLVAFPYLLRSWLSRVGALVASFLLLISPSIAYYSRYIRHDIPVIVWALTVVYAAFSYLRDGRHRWLYLMAGGISLMFATKEVAFIYNAILGFFLVGLFARQAIAKDWGKNEKLKFLLGIALVITVIGMLILSLGALSQRAGGEESFTAVPWWALGGGALAALAIIAGVTALLFGSWQDLRAFRSLDLVIVLGTLCLPFLSPIPIKLVGLDPVDYSAPTVYYSGAITVAVVAISVVIGLLWNWRRWSIAAAIHYAILIVLFTTVFTNGTGIASGLVGSMGYWLAQQGVQRGDQPWYYYGVVVPLYEYLPLLLTVLTASYLAVRTALHRPSISEPPSASADRDLRSGAGKTFVLFVLWWVGTAWVIYSYAGEKMPWLTVHLTLPMILLGAWGLGQFIEAVNWREALQKRLWIPALLAAPLAMAIGMLIHSVASSPFQGSSLAELSATGQFLGSLVAALAFGAGLVYVVRRNDLRDSGRLSLRILLLVALIVPILMTLRHSWHFCYINYDYPIEHLVYAHAAPAVKETMEQIEELSRRVVGGPRQIEVAYGADGSWPFHWYFRDYDNAVFYGENPTREQMDAPVVIAGRQEWDEVAPYMANDYVVNTYTYLWWPMEDYKGLTWERMRNALRDPQMRAALWHIWYDRDYRLYDEATGKTHTVDDWPLRSEYRLYIRRDVIAQIWDRGYVGPRELEDLEPYSENRLELVAREVFGDQGSGRAEFQSPRGIALGPDGSVYVADSGNHRIQRFTGEGEFLDIWGGRSLAEEELGTPRGFNEPWDVAVAPDTATNSEQGIAVYVADTWNHRIQRLDDQGNAVTAWGFFGEFGPDDGEGGQSAFYGPRGVAVAPLTGSGADQLVLVTDTGNKRVQVFGSNGDFAFQWGGGGAVEGYLDEPVGIAFGPEGDVYVADTWNRRVQVFDSDGGFLRQWPIRGWDSGLPEEKPYLAVDGQGHVYITDPGYYRVLVFDSQGNYLASFGQYGTDKQSFGLPQGIAVAADGTIYVTDAHGHRVLIFDPIDFNQLDE
ncbi:MAG: TIGR03663 family protein [Anaerolineae bacterium]